MIGKKDWPPDLDYTPEEYAADKAYAAAHGERDDDDAVPMSLVDRLYCKARLRFAMGLFGRGGVQ